MEEEKNKTEGGTLYLVATPIGNLADLSARALKVLSEVTFIAAEDTRNTAKLLAAFEIKKETFSYHEHNKASAGPKVIERLLAGDSCALVTDAGMPAVSDPGEDLVRLAAAADIPVRVVPGCCAAVSALALSALSTAKFVFEGFLPVKGAERKKRLDVLKKEERTVILYEAPHKLQATLGDLLEALGGERKISLCRELTKRNEETMRTTLDGAVKYYEKNEPRGEYVLILEGAAEAGVTVAHEEKDTELLTLTPTEHVKHYEEKGLAHMDAVKAAAKDRGMSKSDFYKLLIE